MQKDVGSWGRSAPFQDRADAGRQLAERLGHYRGQDAVVFGVPRGGVPVAVEVAQDLDAPLDIVIPRKLGIPFNPEAGYGAVAEDGTIVLNDELVRQLRLSRSQIEDQAQRVRAEIRRRTEVYRRAIPPRSVQGKIAIIIDDGLATGYTVMAAIKSKERSGASSVVVAAPVASDSAYDLLKPLVSELVVPVVSHGFSFAVASYYRTWSDLSDEEVLGYLSRWRERWRRRHLAQERRT